MKTPQVFALIALAAGTLIVYGSQVTWVELASPMMATISIEGAGSEDAKAFIILGALALVLGAVGFIDESDARKVSGVALAITGAYSTYRVMDIKSNLNQLISTELESFGAFASTGQGLNLILIGSIVAVVAGIALFVCSFTHADSPFFSQHVEVRIEQT